MLFKKHCKIRISERSLLTFSDIDIILKNKSYLRIGMDIKKKNICHYLFYSVKDMKHLILLVDEGSNEAISILPDNYSGWEISNESFALTRSLAIAYQNIFDTLQKNYFLVDKFRRLLCSRATKNKWTEFFNSYFTCLKPLLSFDNLEIDPKSQLSSQIIFQFLNNYIPEKNQTDEIVNVKSENQVKLLTENNHDTTIPVVKNYTLTIYFNTYKIEHIYKCSDFDHKLIDKNLIKHIIHKSKKPVSFEHVLYINVSLDNKNEGCFIPKRDGFDYIPIDKHSAQLTGINVHYENESFPVSNRRLRHLQKQHFTDFFNDHYSIMFVRTLIKQKIGHSIKFDFLEFIFEDKYEKEVLILNRN